MEKFVNLPNTCVNNSYYSKNVIIIRQDGDIYNISLKTFFELLISRYPIIQTETFEKIDLKSANIEIFDGEIFTPLTSISKCKSLSDLIAINTKDGASFIVTYNHPILMKDGNIKAACDLYIGDVIYTYTNIPLSSIIDNILKPHINTKWNTPLEIYEITSNMTVCNRTLLISALNLNPQCRVALLAGCIDNIDLFNPVYYRDGNTVILDFDDVRIMHCLYNIARSLDYQKVQLHYYDEYKTILELTLTDTRICKYSKLIKEIQPITLNTNISTIKSIIYTSNNDKWVYNITTETNKFYCGGMVAIA